MPTHNIYLIELPLLVILVSLVYSATRFDQWRPILMESLSWGSRLVVFLAAVGMALYLVTIL